MTFKKTSLLIGHFTLGQVPLFNSLIRRTYLRFLRPALEKLLKAKIEIRHSALDPGFSAFLSDLDTCLIIDNDFNKKIRAFLKIRKVLIMLDLPEIYTSDEFEHLEKIKKSKSNSSLLEFCWHMRKVSWSALKLEKSRHLLDRYKQSRSINKSLDKLGTKKGVVCLNQLSAFDGLIPKDHGPSELCYYSTYIETTRGCPLILELTREQFPFLNSLMPGDGIDPWIKESVDSNFLEAKLSLAIQELYLSRSVLRLKAAMNEKSPAHESWCELLEKNIRDIRAFKDQRDRTYLNEY